MDLRQRTNRFGFHIILWTCILRLVMGLSASLYRQMPEWVRSSIPIYSETGRNVRFSFYEFFRESPPPRIPMDERPAFSGEDADLVKMDYDCALRPDIQALVEQPLNWDLADGEPRVLILHTHTTESYTRNGETYIETAAYRTLDETCNMLSIGDAVAQILTENGIGVIHDRQLHDYPSYNDAYVHARNTAASLLEQYPSVCLVLDLHRDALEQKGKQLRLVADTGEDISAQLMFVVGTDITRPAHENWQENLSLALKLQVLLERSWPGIMRPVNLRSQRFNQDLCPGALLVEVGTAGNTQAEALRAGQKLAEAVVSLARGTQAEPIDQHPE